MYILRTMTLCHDSSTKLIFLSPAWLGTSVTVLGIHVLLSVLSRMQDSQSREPGFEFSLCYRFEARAFSFSPRRPSSLSYVKITNRRWWKCECIVFAHNCRMAECLAEKSSWCQNEHVCQRGKCTGCAL